MKKVLAIDVGGTKISYSIINENGEFLEEVNKTSTPKDIDELIKIFKEIISNNENKVDMISFLEMKYYKIVYKVPTSVIMALFLVHDWQRK